MASFSRETGVVIERIKKILATGANVILTAQGIDDLCLKEFIEAGAMAVRRCKKEDLRRIAKATGATMVSSLANLDGEESFEATSLGFAEEVEQVRISDDELILIKGTKIVNSSSIILRGANDYMLDEMERALHDSLSIIKRTLESGTVIPGGGAVEVALSIYLENFATTLVRASHYYPHCRGKAHPFPFSLPAFPVAGWEIFRCVYGVVRILTCNIFFLVNCDGMQGSREQLAIAEFANALLTIPKILAVNAAKDATQLVAKLRTFHHAAQNAPSGDPKKALLHYGLDLLNGEVRDNLKAGVLEPTMSKVKSLKSAYEAAVSLLRIDDAIQCAPGECFSTAG